MANHHERTIKIANATYGPAGDKRLLTGELSNEESARIPFTRDVTPFLRALFVLRRQQANQDDPTGSKKRNSSQMENDTSLEELMDHHNNSYDELFPVGEHTQNFIPIMDGKSMNAVFGDPCPGISKRLHVRYIIYETLKDVPDRSELFRVNFAEHERVILRTRSYSAYQDDLKIQSAFVATENLSNCQGDEIITQLKDGRIRLTQSIAEFSGINEQNNVPNEHDLNGTTNKVAAAMQLKWKLWSATSEISLPIILPFLRIKERMHCQLVCKVWRFVVQHWGVASTVDSNDQAFPNFSCDFLRGILAHSQNSLHSLFLCDFHVLAKEDLHPAIPHLRKLRSLDVSRCHQLDDATMYLLAKHISQTLQVLYMKGLRKVTDEGLIAICQSCQRLEVLEISNIPITDKGATCIGENLPLLKALYMRDNFLLTNRSIDTITKKCHLLSELTLWGCTKLCHLKFCNDDQMRSGGRLVLLNLWGCNSLLDETANALTGMHHLRSLVASECHKLTNSFLLALALKVPNLKHLHLRYCMKITDEGINAIANSLHNLHSLDVSFCARVTIAAVLNLIKVRHQSLVELRLQHCSQLDIVRDFRQVDRQINRREGVDGLSILNVLKACGQKSNLCLLDLRSCGGHNQTYANYPENEPFVKGMRLLSFEQKLGGFFVRPLRWDLEIQRQLVDQIMTDDLALEQVKERLLSC